MSLLWVEFVSTLGGSSLCFDQQVEAAVNSPRSVGFLIICLCVFGMEIRSETGMAVQEGSQVQAVPLPIQLPAGDLGKQ